MSTEVLPPLNADWVVPDDFQFPEPLQQSVPRDLPERFTGCRSTRELRSIGIAGLIAGILLACLTLVPGIEKFSDAFAIVRHLHLIAFVVAVIGSVALMTSLFRKGDAKYLTSGYAAAAKITSISLNATHMQHGMVSHRAFEVRVEIVKSAESPILRRSIYVFEMSSEKAAMHELTLQPGQWTTVVCMNENFSGALKLYDCLDFHRELPLRKRAAARNPSRLVDFVAGSFLVALLSTVFWNIWAINRYSVIGGIPWLGIAVIICIAAVLGMLVIGCLSKIISQDRTTTHYILDDQQREQIVETDDAPMSWEVKILFALGTYLMTTVFLLTYVSTANSWLDWSQPAIEQAKVTRAQSTIYNGVYQTYSILLTIPGREQTSHKIRTDASTYQRIVEAAANEGVNLEAPFANESWPRQIEVRRGAFGWPWVSKL